MNVEQQRSGGVCRVGDVMQAACHARDEVGVDGADRYATADHLRPRCRVVIAHPRDLGPAEVGIKAQACELGDSGFVPGCAQIGAHGRCTPVLPHDGPARGPQRLPIPEADGLALIRDADRRGSNR